MNSRPQSPAFFKFLASAVALLSFVVAGASIAAEVPTVLTFYVGTYTGGASEGIYRSSLDLSTGAVAPAKLAVKARNPSFLAIHPSQRFLYSVGEIGDFAGSNSGSVSAFAIDPQSGDLKPLNQQPSGGGGPCHLVVDHAGKHVLVANYGGGSVASLPILDGGKLGKPTSVIQHQGSSVNPGRQERPHAHSINLDPSNRFAIAADLGLDKVLVYRFDAGRGTLTAHDPPGTSVEPGAGPRHFAFHPGGRFAYVINEMHLTVTAFRYDAEHGKLTTIQTISTLPPDAKGDGMSTAEVLVHPSGRFLYGSNRGHDSITAFSINESTGKLTYVQNEPTQGKAPRNFRLDPTGTFLLVENQDSASIVVFRIDPTSGELRPTGHSLEVPRPVCIRFLTEPPRTK